MNTKKILLYSGSALLLGAVGFFVWSFFQKTDVPATEDGSTESPIASSASSSNQFSSMPTYFEPIKKPDIQSDLDWLMKNVSKN